MIKIRFRKLRILGKWLLAGSIVTIVTYPIIISPMLDPRPYKEMQQVLRKDIIQEDVQPGNMKIWTDPFNRKK